jgi:hypothetical protein
MRIGLALRGFFECAWELGEIKFKGESDTQQRCRVLDCGFSRRCLAAF